MHKFFLFLFFISVTCLLSSCDIPGRFIVTNKTKGEVAMRIYRTTNTDTLDIEEIKLPNEIYKNKYGRNYDFGFSWTDERIEEFIEPIDKIEIETYNYTRIIDKKEDIFIFFKKNRRGLFKEEMAINIKDKMK